MMNELCSRLDSAKNKISEHKRYQISQKILLKSQKDIKYQTVKDMQIRIRNCNIN